MIRILKLDLKVAVILLLVEKHFGYTTSAPPGYELVVPAPTTSASQDEPSGSDMAIQSALIPPKSVSSESVVQIQRCSSFSEENSRDIFKVPKGIYDPKVHRNHTDNFHRFYDEDLFHFIPPKSDSLTDPNSNEFTCAPNMTEISFTIIVPEDQMSETTSKSKTLPYPSKYFLPTGYLRYSNHTDVFYFPPELYCISSYNTSSVTGRACKPENNTNFLQVRRCSSFIGSLTLTSGIETRFSPKLFPDFKQDPWNIFRDSRFPAVLPEQRPFYYKTSLSCGKGSSIVSDPNVLYFQNPNWYTDIRVLKNGTLLGRSRGNEAWQSLETVFKSQEFCLDVFQVSENETVKPEYRRFLVNCPPPSEGNTLVTSYKYLLMLSLFFLGLILLIYGLLWKHQNVHGRTAAAFVSSMFLTFFSILLNNFQTFSYRSKACAVNGIIQHFFNLSMYSWMAVMNFDVWSTITSMVAASQRSKGNKRFLVYCLCAYGAPVIIVTVSVILHTTYTIDNESIKLPQYGFVYCSTHPSVFAYYFLTPIALDFLISCTFGGLTIWTLYKCSREAGKLTSTNVKKKSRHQWALAFKLVCLTGISWILDLIQNIFYSSGNITLEWWFVDVYNFSQSIFLFWILVIKRDVKDQLGQNFKNFRMVFTWVDEKYVQVTRSIVSSSGQQPTVSTNVDDERSVDLTKVHTHHNAP